MLNIKDINILIIDKVFLLLFFIDTIDNIIDINANNIPIIGNIDNMANINAINASLLFLFIY